MARVVAVANRKGGVGKTTTSLNLAHGLHNAGYHVLLVDLDEQHNSTRHYKARMACVATVYDLLTSRDIPTIDAIQTSETYGDIIPGDDLTVVASERMSTLDSREFMLVDSLRQVDGVYDYIIIDCPPTLGLVTKNALIAADEVIVPVMCDGYSDDAFEVLMEQIAVIRTNRRYNPDLGQVRMLITQYDANTNISRKFEERLPELAAKHGAGIFSVRIRRCTKTREAADEGVPLSAYAPRSTTAKDYSRFVEEFLARS